MRTLIHWSASLAARQGNSRQQTNRWVCRAADTVSGAVAGAVGGATFAVATGNINPAEIAAAAAGGAVVGGVVAAVSPNGGVAGAVTAAVSSLATHVSGGTTAEGAAELAGDTAAGAFPSPVAALPIGVATGAVAGAVGEAGVLGAAGSAGGALIGGNAGGLAALATDSALRAIASRALGCP